MLSFPGTRGFSPKKFTHLIIILCLGSECALLNAQTASPSPSPGTQPGELNQITVTAVPPEDQVVPTARPINSVFGQDMGIIDTPRSVNVIIARSSKTARFYPFRISANFRPVLILPRNTVWMAFPISAASTRSFSRTDSERFFIEIVLFRASIKWSRSTF